MDLKHDWKALNEVLFSQASLTSTASTLVLLEDEGKVVDGVVSSGKAFGDNGAEGVATNKELLDALAAKYGADQAMVISKKSIDQYVVEAATLGTNYYQQLQAIRSKVLGEEARSRKGGAIVSQAHQGRGDARTIVSRKHFVLDLFGSKLRRMLPRRFNVLIFIDQRTSAPALNFMASASAEPFSYRSILLSYSGGQLDQFYEPDFSSLHENRLMNWQQESEAIGQYLETRYILPCYALYMYEEDWQRCLMIAAQKGRPWRTFAKYYDDGRAAVYPRGILTKALLAGQRLMVYFGRL